MVDSGETPALGTSDGFSDLKLCQGLVAREDQCQECPLFDSQSLLF